MQGQKAVVVLIIAMILTAGVGFFANVSQENSTRTEYSTVGNLDAFMSANSSPTPQSELFNSVYNVIGWNGDINTTNTVLPPGRSNQYVYKEESTDHKDFNLPYNYGMHAYTLSGHYSGQSGDSTSWTNGFFKTSLSDSQNVYMYKGLAPVPAPSGITDADLGKLFVRDPVTFDLTPYGDSIGGYGQTTSFTTTGHTLNSTLNILLNDTSHNSSGLFISDLTDVIENTPLWIVTSDNKLAYDDEYSPMIYTTKGDAIAKYNEYRVLYTNHTWNYKQMELTDYTDQTRIYVNIGNVGFIGGYSATYTYTHSESGTQWTGEGTFSVRGDINETVDYLQYRSSTQQWYAYSNSSNRALWNSDKVAVYSTDGSNLAYSLTLQQDYVIPAVYFDPTRYMGIEGTATWSNYDLNRTMVNTEVTFLWKGTGDIKINGDDGPVLKIRNVGNTYSVETSPNVFSPIGSYKGLEITLRASSEVVTIRGILEEQSNEGIPSTQDYIPSAISYDVALYDANPSDETIPTVPDKIYRLKFQSSNGFAYIFATYILTDPNSLLWTDININLEDYFEDYKDGMRVLFQGFVRYGDQITVNGQSWDIVNSGFTVTVTEIVTPAQGEPGDENYRPPVTRTYDVPFNMNGLAVDYYDGHCKLVQTNGRSTVDLGEISDYVINMRGTWFFSSSLSTISVIPSKETVWNPGWDMDMNTTLLLFAGCVIFLSVLMMMRFRDMMGWEDIVILICSIVVPLVLVAV